VVSGGKRELQMPPVGTLTRRADPCHGLMRKNTAFRPVYRAVPVHTRRNRLRHDRLTARHAVLPSLVIPAKSGHRRGVPGWLRYRPKIGAFLPHLGDTAAGFGGFTEITKRIKRSFCRKWGKKCAKTRSYIRRWASGSVLGVRCHIGGRPRPRMRLCCGLFIPARQPVSATHAKSRRRRTARAAGLTSAKRTRLSTVHKGLSPQKVRAPLNVLF
jgi:hypothetical protein